jgi:hypothetical protein
MHNLFLFLFDFPEVDLRFFFLSNLVSYHENDSSYDYNIYPECNWCASTIWDDGFSLIQTITRMLAIFFILFPFYFEHQVPYHQDCRQRWSRMREMVAFTPHLGVGRRFVFICMRTRNGTQSLELCHRRLLENYIIMTKPRDTIRSL